MRCLTLLFALTLAVAALSPAHAAEQTLRIDPENTRIDFTLGGSLHDVHGSLFLDRGQLSFDMDSGQVRGEIVIDALRTVSGNKKRDRKMHGEVLESQLFPQIRLRPSRIEGQLPAAGSATVTLHGTISIHGQDHEVSLPAQISREGQRLHATLSLSVPYVEWGMTDPSVFVLRVAKVVDVHIEMDGTLE